MLTVGNVPSIAAMMMKAVSFHLWMMRRVQMIHGRQHNTFSSQALSCNFPSCDDRRDASGLEKSRASDDAFETWQGTGITTDQAVLTWSFHLLHTL